MRLRRNASDSCAPLGGFALFWLDVYVPPGSLNAYSVEAFRVNFSGAADDLLIGDLRLAQVR